MFLDKSDVERLATAQAQVSQIERNALKGFVHCLHGHMAPTLPLVQKIERWIGKIMRIIYKKALSCDKFMASIGVNNKNVPMKKSKNEQIWSGISKHIMTC